jgi:hypothetical protein
VSALKINWTPPTYPDIPSDTQIGGQSRVAGHHRGKQHHGGAGSALATFLANESLVQPILHLGLPDSYLEPARPADMLAECGLDAAGIEASVLQRLALLHCADD